MKKEWVTECIRWHGRVLIGRKSHFCSDWDFLPIDETMKEEIEVCTCLLVSSAPEDESPSDDKGD